MNTTYINNKFIPLKKAKISILDRGFLYGDGVFETMRSYKGVVFRLEKHIERLYKSLKMLHINLKIPKTKIEKIVYELLKKNNLSNAYIKIIITRGKSGGLTIPTTHNPRRSLGFGGQAKPTILIYTLPYTEPKKYIYNKGIKVNISKTSLNEKSEIKGQKTLNYLQNILCRYNTNKKGFDDAIFVNTRGFVSEATSSNVFFIRRKRIFTPSLGCGMLPGITRQEIINLSKRFLECKVSEVFVKAKSLYSADEIFLTNSLQEIVPVVRIDKRLVGNGKPGYSTKKLMNAFRYSVIEHCNRYKNA